MNRQGIEICGLEFEDRMYQVHEIRHKLGIPKGTWNYYLYDKIGQRKKNGGRFKPRKLKDLKGVYKLPNSNLRIIDPKLFVPYFFNKLKTYYEE